VRNENLIYFYVEMILNILTLFSILLHCVYVERETYNERIITVFIIPLLFIVQQQRQALGKPYKISHIFFFTVLNHNKLLQSVLIWSHAKSHC
jgi:hypothetical protein